MMPLEPVIGMMFVSFCVGVATGLAVYHSLLADAPPARRPRRQIAVPPQWQVDTRPQIREKVASLAITALTETHRTLLSAGDHERAAEVLQTIREIADVRDSAQCREHPTWIFRVCR